MLNLNTVENPNWLRRGLWAAAILALSVGYPASAGPAVYSVSMDWLPRDVMLFYGPVRAVAMRSPLRSAWINYWSYWADAAGESMRRKNRLPISFGWEYDVLER